MDNIFLNIDNFSCGYGKKFCIKNITFQIPKGVFAGIIGPNGSGKTTLFKGLTNELKRLEGSIYLDGKGLHDMSVREKAQNIAIVSQTIDPQPILVSDYVLLGRTPYRNKFSLIDKVEDIAIAEHYMELTGTWKFRNHYLDELSGGEQQLASIARALTQEPQLLLLDEPTAHLDITHQVQVLNLIQKLNTNMGLTVLMIIHDLNLASEYCNYLVMLNNGEIHIKGNPDEVLTYKTIEDVYHTVVVTRTNPMSGKPVIILVSEQVLLKKSDN